ncbi:MAG: hypothetical protein HDS00_08020 [Bacteroides sp.]|nr:hypothetical protein [Bacteroides sp.]
MDTTTTVEFDPDFSDRIYGYRILVVEGPGKEHIHLSHPKCRDRCSCRRYRLPHPA